MQVIGIDKSLQSMEDAMIAFEEQSGYKLDEAQLAIFQYSWIVSATATMKAMMKEKGEDEA